MTLRHALAAALLVLPAAPLRAADPFTVKTTMAPPPKEVAEPVRKTLGDRCVQLTDAKGEAAVEFWPCKAVEAKATEAQVKNGLTYREIPETTLLGVLKVNKPWTDYRKQKVPPGVYTLRLAYQPMDGDHMGTAPYSEFALISPAAEDKKPDTMEAKALHEISAKSTNNHPGVYLLFPGKDAGDPKLVDKGDGHWILLYKQPVTAGSTPTSIGIALTVVGAAAS
jgi:hypothetical protein